MARRQTALPDATAAQRFASRLRALRTEADLTLRQVAVTSGYSHSTLSTAESGRRLPSWDVTAAFVQACGDKDVTRWRGLWEAAAETQPADNSAEGVPPDPITEPRATPPMPWPARWWAHGITAVVTAALTVALFLVASPLHRGSDSSPTESCGGSGPGIGCHRKDPKSDTWNCRDGAIQAAKSDLDWQGAPAGVVENWYSPRCGTHWAMLRLTKGWRGRIEIASASDRLCYPVNCTDLDAAEWPAWTDMVFSVNAPTTATAVVELPDMSTHRLVAASS